jgi:hypothetical protein
MPAPTLLVSTVAAEDEAAARMGSASYSYYYVYEAFAPLLERWQGPRVHLAFVPPRE